MESDAGKPIKRRKRKEFGPADYSRLHSLRLRNAISVDGASIPNYSGFCEMGYGVIWNRTM
ncbi:hypothetical protein DAPPUDRAFT_260409 [Daphnia pulex]|uniref:Uncharacterized protein n=1 Tax=Daphnia pulex TaxID=6669 RepID=E9HJ48_DAPPU|nr:hypothetical protein DAPPUDRAFT_260409 [Daphnia pulex]|eukprot:EFX68258.1 hypothetical protein DAPPUDRAFT_260409 [Daphnia pulex]